MKTILLKFFVFGCLFTSSQVFAAEVKRDFSTVMQGANLYQKNCASCHGEQGQGKPGWRTIRTPEGKLLPPPLNGTGHAWHHPLNAIRQTVILGGAANGGTMPGFKNKLKISEIDAIIAWFQSRWPDKIFKQWEKTNKRGHH